MRIGVDGRSLLEPFPSGVSYYTKNILENILSIDDKNQYILFYNSYKPGKLYGIKYFSKFQNVIIKGFSYPNKVFNGSIILFNQPKIDLLMGGVDVFFAPNLQFLSLSEKCRKIITVHDLSFELYPQFLSWKRKMWHKFVNPKKFIGSADKIIAVSDNTKNDLIKLYGINSEKIKVVHSAIQENHDALISENLPVKYILTVSTIEPRKNLEGLISAFNLLVKKDQFKDYQLLIAGPRGWKADYVFHMAKFNKQIKFLGFVSDSFKTQLYKKASAFAYPSFYEGFGFPPLEAISYGVPCLVSANSSLPEILGSAALYVDPYNVFDIASGLEKILINENLRQAMIKNGKIQAQKFSWQRAAQETMDMIINNHSCASA